MVNLWNVIHFLVSKPVQITTYLIILSMMFNFCLIRGVYYPNNWNFWQPPFFLKWYFPPFYSENFIFKFFLIISSYFFPNPPITHIFGKMKSIHPSLALIHPFHCNVADPDNFAPDSDPVLKILDPVPDPAWTWPNIEHFRDFFFFRIRVTWPKSPGYSEPGSATIKKQKKTFIFFSLIA